MKHEPHDFEAPTRRAELKEWLATLRGPGKRVVVNIPPVSSDEYLAACVELDRELETNNADLYDAPTSGIRIVRMDGKWLADPMKRHT